MEIRFDDGLSFAGGVFCLSQNKTVKLIYEANRPRSEAPVRPIPQSIYKKKYVDSHV